jgi:hypothetical protein
MSSVAALMEKLRAAIFSFWITDPPRTQATGKVDISGEPRPVCWCEGQMCSAPKTQALRAIAMPGGRAENNTRLPL